MAWFKNLKTMTKLMLGFGALALLMGADAAGAKLVTPVADQQYGRSGGVEDPFGLTWWITTP